MDLRAVVFVPALAGCVIFGFVFALFAAHYYLSLLQSTGSGAREVSWPAEPILDQFWKVFYLAWLIGLWLGPAWLLGRVLTAGSEAVWLRYAIPLAVFWLCYPVSQLSSLGGPTIWLPFHPPVLERLVRKAAILPGFFLLSAAVLTVFGFAFYWTFRAPGIITLVGGSVLMVVSALAYGRLIGRLAYALAYTRSSVERIGKKKRKRAKRSDREDSDDAPSSGVEPHAGEAFSQPSSLPPIETPDEGPLTGYDLVMDSATAQTRRRVVAEVVREDEDDESTFSLVPDEPAPAAEAQPDRPEREDSPEDEVEDEDIPYEVNAPEVEAEERLPQSVVRAPEHEMKLLSRDDVPRPLTRVWTPDLALFLVQPGSISVVLLLSAMCFAVGGMVRIAREFDPTR